MERIGFRLRRILSCAIAISIALVGTPAFAGKPDHPAKGHEHGGKPPKAYRSKGGPGGPVAVYTFSPSQRESAVHWYHESYGDGCPPGLAKKHNGCLPPGHAKKRYVIGHPLPYGVVLAPLPPPLVVVLGAPPVGYRYGILDGDVVKLAIGTALVVDAIEGLANR